LQELVAPREVELYDRNWKFMGTRGYLCDVIFGITKIGTAFLRGEKDIRNISIAGRMSLMAKRKTTMEEDRAYSLMGAFGINMSVFYGEGGEAAFLRLQVELIRISTVNRPSSKEHRNSRMRSGSNSAAISSDWPPVQCPAASTIAGKSTRTRKGGKGNMPAPWKPPRDRIF
jgi:hypothetical protein